MGMSSVKIAWLHRPDNGPFEVKGTAIKPMPRADSGDFMDGNKSFVAGVIKSACWPERSANKEIASWTFIHAIYGRGGAVICRPAACHHMARVNGASDAAAAARAMTP